MSNFCPYRTRCRNSLKHGGCTNSRCSFYHDGFGKDRNRELRLQGHQGSEGQGGGMRNKGTGWQEHCGSSGRQIQERFDSEMENELSTSGGSSHIFNDRTRQGNWDSIQTFKNVLEDKLEFEQNGEEEILRDKDCRVWGNGRHINDRKNLQRLGPNHVKCPVSQGSKSQYYNYRTSQQEQCLSGPEKKESIGRKPKTIQQCQIFDKAVKKRNFSAVDSDLDAESERFSSKKLKQDVDLRLERIHVDSFNFPEDLIGQLLGKKGVINRIKTLCSPAVITVPTFCNSEGFRIIKIEGYKMQIEKSKAVIYKLFKEIKIEHVVEHFKNYLKIVEDPGSGRHGYGTVGHDSNEFKGDEFRIRDLETEALRGKLNNSEGEKRDLQKRVSKLKDDNYGLMDVKHKLEDQNCQLKKEVKDQKEIIQILKVENKNCKIEKDFCEAEDKSWKQVYLGQIEELNCQIEAMANELKKNESELEEKELLINDLEQTSEIRLKDVLELQSQWQREFVQCDKCEEKFRSNELLRRHMRFKH